MNTWKILILFALMANLPNVTAATGMSTEENTKRYQCRYCTKRMHSSSHLRHHECVHTGEKPSACPHCEYKTIQNSNLKLHIRRCHLSPNQPRSMARRNAAAKTTAPVASRSCHSRQTRNNTPFVAPITQKPEQQPDTEATNNADLLADLVNAYFGDI